MRVGYCLTESPQLASYRLRVAVPAPHLGCDYVIGTTGKPTFFYKNGNVRLAEHCGPLVYDVVNDHFRGPNAPDYHGMCSIANIITTSSEAMAQTVKHYTGRDAVVIEDPYETDEITPDCEGNGVAWIGHSANIRSLVPFLQDIPMIVCSNIANAHVPWSLENEAKVLKGAAVVLLTANNPGASANRVIKALRAGRFVVCTEMCPASWKELRDFIWVGHIQDGIDWALNNREEACKKILAGQNYIRERFSPRSIGSRWGALFASI